MTTAQLRHATVRAILASSPVVVSFDTEDGHFEAELIDFAFDRTFSPATAAEPRQLKSERLVLQAQAEFRVRRTSDHPAPVSSTPSEFTSYELTPPCGATILYL